MKFVLMHDVGDMYVWSWTDSVPFEYESKEKFYYDLMEACLKSIELNKTDFNFLGKDFNLKDFGHFTNEKKLSSYVFSEPVVLTLEEWFETYKIAS